MLRPAQTTREPERNCIRLRSVGYNQDKLSNRPTQEVHAARRDNGRLEWLQRRQNHGGNQQHRRYLIDNTKELLAMRVSVVAEFIYPMRK